MLPLLLADVICNSITATASIAPRCGRVRAPFCDLPYPLLHETSNVATVDAAIRAQFESHKALAASESAICSNCGCRASAPSWKRNKNFCRP